MASDRLENIPLSEWPQLRDLFLSSWPADLVGYRTLQHYIEIKEKNPLYKIHILSLNGGWGDGTFLAFDGVQLQVYTMEESCERLERAVELMPKCLGVRFRSVPEKCVGAVERALTKCKAVDVRHIFQDRMSGTYLYWLPKEIALKLGTELPFGTYTAPVDLKHVKYINSLWPNSYVSPKEHCEYGPHFGIQNGVNPTEPKSSQDWIADMIINSDSVGLYDAKTNDLLSWVMILHNDGLCALQTDDKHQRKGYGGVVLRNISRNLALKGKDTFGFVSVNNTPSMNLFNKEGFRILNRAFWVEVKAYESPDEMAELKRLYDICT